MSDNKIARLGRIIDLINQVMSDSDFYELLELNDLLKMKEKDIIHLLRKLEKSKNN